MSQPKKKFKDTKVGKFLLGKSGIINVISNILPDQGALGMVKNLIDKDQDLDGFDISFGINSGWIDLLKSLLITVYVAYFGSRGVEKFKSITNN